MKRIISALVITVLSVSSLLAEEPIDWFKNAKLGMFIHWGLYSQTAGEWKGHPTKGGEHFML